MICLHVNAMLHIFLIKMHYFALYLPVLLLISFRFGIRLSASSLLDLPHSL